uniref:Glycosyltransferase n=1 Tax=viral metagenome TaxID=1070528 RepID=A0A6C0LZG7_9ZZZZ
MDIVRIPKIVMQTWKTNVVPDEWKPSRDAILKYMPSWEYVLMTDEDNRVFVKEHFPEFYPFFQTFRYPIQKADAIRACWLYVKGGLYIDLDLEILKPLDDLFTVDANLFFVSAGTLSSYVTNSFMAAKPKDPLWLQYIDNMKKIPPDWAMTKHLEVMAVTGPMSLTYVLRNTDRPYLMIPKRYIKPCNECDGNIGCDLTEAYVKPLKGGSWESLDSKILNWWRCKWYDGIQMLLMFVLAYVMYKVCSVKHT